MKFIGENIPLKFFGFLRKNFCLFSTRVLLPLNKETHVSLSQSHQVFTRFQLRHLRFNFQIMQHTRIAYVKV